MAQRVIKNKEPVAHIIGSGIAGLATAVRLRLKGYEVHVWEKNLSPGGKIHSFYLGDYRFDGGPSLFTMPQYVDELFQLAGKNPRNYYEYEEHDIACNYFWNDGTSLTAYTDVKSFAREVEEKLGVDGDPVIKRLHKASDTYNLVGSIFVEQSLHQWSTWLSRNVGKALLRLPKYDLHRSMHSANQRDFKNEKLVQLFDRFATYNGSNPYKSPGMLNMIPHLEFGEGVWFPKGGMVQIPQAIFQLGTELGVKFHFGKHVSRIVTSGKQATGIVANLSMYPADLVVSNMDVYFTYRDLLFSGIPNKVEKQERSSSALVFYWGIKKKFDQLDLHNIFFSDHYEEEFDSLFKSKTLAKDPTVYVHVSSKKDPLDAPRGKENWFVMINAPAMGDTDWNEYRREARIKILGKLSTILNEDLEELIEEERFWDPPGIERQTLSYKGSIYGTSSNSKAAAFNRHTNFSSRYKNLYFCGGSVHPGGGIPLCLNSAKIVADMVPYA